jgi:hypothetical protein
LLKSQPSAELHRPADCKHYGWRSPPSQIPEDDFQAIRAVVVGQDQTLLETWYTLDTNAVPAERRLNPRKKGGLYECYKDWQPVESELQQILSDAVDRLNWTTEKRLPYQASATHQEIVRGALEQTDAPEHVFCFFRSIPDLLKTFSAPEYQAMLKNRLVLEYPWGLSPACIAMVDAVLNLMSEATAEVVRTQTNHALEDAPDESPEQDILKFMRQVLADMIAKDFFNLDEMRWTVGDNAYKNLITCEVGLALLQFLTAFAAGNRAPTQIIDTKTLHYQSQRSTIFRILTVGAGL